MKNLLFGLLICLFTLNLSASHFVGGDITWECISDPTSLDYGKFIFQLTLYGDCIGIDFPGANAGGSKILVVKGHPTITQIDCPWISSTDISPTGTPAAGTTCHDCISAGGIANPFNIPNGFTVQEHIFRSAPISLGNGNIPDPTGAVWNQLTNSYDVLPRGWHFVWSSNARNGAVNTTTQSSYLLRAVMYPYTKNTSVIPFVYEDAFPCYDSSPLFKEKAKTLLCTDVPFSYSHLAFDADFDSLAYSWAYPLESSSGNYDPGNIGTWGEMVFVNSTNTPGAPYDFSVTEQIPTNPAFPLTLNEGTGEISFMNDVMQGPFLTCVRVRSVKCFQPIADVFREVQIVATDIACNLASGVPNTPPDITSPVGTQVWTTSFNSSGLPSYSTEIMAGELVQFDVIATDIDMQNITLEIEGSQIDASLALSNPATFIINSAVPGSTEGTFSWLSSCDHLIIDSCAGSPNQSFNFNLKAYDDFCPANGTTIANITINLIPPTPDIRCLAVEPGGDVEVSWYYPLGLINAIIDYDMYFSKDLNGPYTKIAALSYPDSTYLHVNSGADISSSFYYMIAKGACVSAINTVNTVDSISDTLQTIFMEASEVISVPIFAYLDWNYLRINNTPGFAYNVATTKDSFSLFYEYDVALGFDTAAKYMDTIANKTSDFCSYDPRFYVEIEDKRGCVSRSNIAVTHLSDDTPPDIPIIKDVSVDLNGKSIISWIPSIDAEIYAIYILDESGAWITVDTVFAPDSTYTYAASNANEYFETFSIRALDSCENAKAASLAHNSINLYLDLEPCDQTFDLRWNKYINWFNGLGFYKLTVEETDLSGITVIDTYRLDSNATGFLLEGLVDKYTYKLFIDVFNSDSSFTAHSNELVIVPALPKRPDYNYIDYASINHIDGSVEINCLVDKTAIIDHYDVLRSTGFNGSFSKVGVVPFDNSDVIHYNDNTAQTQTQSYQYRIYPVDTCGVSLYAPSVFGDPFNDTSYAQTILLEAEINIDSSSAFSLEGEYTNTLVFNEYDKWLGDVSEYRLYRSVNREPYNLIPLYVWDRVSYPDEPLEFVDFVTEFGDGNGRFCYYIEAVEGVVSPYGPAIEGSLSNIACVSQTPIIFVPSVFTPNGDEHNEVFRPITYFVSEVGYSFSIYNRHGVELFSTDNPLKGWDGSYRGEQVQNGNYVYHLQFLNGVGNLTEKTDVITLVR